MGDAAFQIYKLWEDFSSKVNTFDSNRLINYAQPQILRIKGLNERAYSLIKNINTEQLETYIDDTNKEIREKFMEIDQNFKRLSKIAEATKGVYPDYTEDNVLPKIKILKKYGDEWDILTKNAFSSNKIPSLKLNRLEDRWDKMIKKYNEQIKHLSSLEKYVIERREEEEGLNDDELELLQNYYDKAQNKPHVRTTELDLYIGTLERLFNIGNLVNDPEFGHIMTKRDYDTYEKELKEKIENLLRDKYEQVNLEFIKKVNDKISKVWEIYNELPDKSETDTSTQESEIGKDKIINRKEQEISRKLAPYRGVIDEYRLRYEEIKRQNPFADIDPKVEDLYLSNLSIQDDLRTLRQPQLSDQFFYNLLEHIDDNVRIIQNLGSRFLKNPRSEPLPSSIPQNARNQGLELPIMTPQEVYRPDEEVRQDINQQENLGLESRFMVDLTPPESESGSGKKGKRHHAVQFAGMKPSRKMAIIKF